MQHVGKMCVFHWFFQCFGLQSFLLVMSVCSLALVHFGPFGVPKKLQIWTPNCLHKGFRFRDVFLFQFGSVLVPFLAPQICPTIVSRALWAHLSILKLHLGGPRVSPSQFWLLIGPFGALRGAFVPHFGLPRAHFEPLWPPFESLIGPSGTLQGAFACSSR